MTGRNIQKYGQHFLISQRVINEIVDAADVLKAENLVEIGILRAKNLVGIKKRCNFVPKIR